MLERLISVENGASTEDRNSLVIMLSRIYKTLLCIYCIIVPFQPTIFSERTKLKLAVTTKTANISIGTDVTLYDQSDLYINCDIKSKRNASVSVQWKSTSASVKFQQAIKTVPILYLKSIDSRENGVYVCSVKDENNHGDEQRSIINVICKLIIIFPLTKTFYAQVIIIPINIKNS